jgi:hypothetical protein
MKIDMKKRAVILLFLLISFTRLSAQIPTITNWKVIESNYQYTMTFVAKLNVDGVQLKNSNDWVGAFVGTTCRGVSGLTYVANEKSYFAYLTVFSNTPDEAITFYLFDSSKNKVTKVSKTIPFVAYQHLGNLFQSYSIAEPALSNKAEIVSFDFLNINKVSSVISSGSVKLGISQGNPLTDLTPVYVLSNGARLYKNRTLQSSGSTSMSFIAPVNFEVLSEDESTLVSYTVEVTPTLVPAVFYKKDVVCYEGGFIKVLFPIEKENVVLTKAGVTLSTQIINTGQAIFSNLTEGTYQISVGGNLKEIKINLKPSL